jgi:hypothetical protein
MLVLVTGSLVNCSISLPQMLSVAKRIDSLTHDTLFADIDILAFPAVISLDG